MHFRSCAPRSTAGCSFTRHFARRRPAHPRCWPLAICMWKITAPGVMPRDGWYGASIDFDEAFPLPYTIDLVRLATSAWLAIELGHLSLGRANACAAILEGYTKGLEDGG